MVDSSCYQVPAETTFVCWVLHESELGKRLQGLWESSLGLACGPMSRHLLPLQKEVDQEIVDLTRAAIIFRHAPDFDLSRLFLKSAVNRHQFVMRLETKAGLYLDYLVDWSPRHTVS